MEGLKKEQIRDRLVRLASEKWNIQESEVDSNFDPLMLLLFDALASELEGVGHLIKNIQGGLLKELSGLMLPQALLNARPASSVISAMPTEKTCTINQHTSFISSTQIQKTGEPVQEMDINFTSIGSFNLFQLQLTYLFTGGKLFKYGQDGKRSIAFEGSTPDMVQQIQFAVQNPLALESLSGLQLFFDLKGHSEAGNFYNALQQSVLLVNGIPVDFTNGYFQPEQFEITLSDALKSGNNYSRKIQKEIAGIYRRQFITVTHSSIPEKKEATEIFHFLPENLIKELNVSDIIFFTIQLARPFPSEVLERLQMGVNAFPVINRNKELKNFKTDKWINIIPLPVNGSFLDVENIEGADGSKYRLHDSSKEKELMEGEAIIRHTRVGKSSSSEIRNTIQRLLESIRDESAYFSRISNDFISTRLSEISKILTRLEDQMELSKDEKESFRYLLLKPHKVGEMLQIAYWVTRPELAKFVKAGQSFKANQQTLTKNGFCFSLIAAAGGVDTRSEFEQKQMLVRQLSSRGKLISAEDIKLLCFEIFGSKLKQVEVGKIMRVLPSRQAGVSRIISINLKLNKQQLSADELVYFENQLRYQLETNASFSFPYEICLEEA